MGHHMARECKHPKKVRNPAPVAPTTDIRLPTRKPGPSSGGVACSVCGRKFSADRLGTHQSICRRNHKEDDSAAKKSQTAKQSASANGPPPEEPITNSTSWRNKRDEMKRMMRTHQQRVSEVDFELVMEPAKKSPEIKMDSSTSALDQTTINRHVSECGSPRSFNSGDSLYETDSLEGDSPMNQIFNSLAVGHPETNEFDLRDPLALINAADSVLADYDFPKTRSSPSYFAPRTGRYSYTSSCESTPDNTVIFN